MSTPSEQSPHDSRRNQSLITNATPPPKAQTGLAPLSVPKTGLGGIFARAAQSSDHLHGFAVILRDKEFLEALGATSVFFQTNGSSLDAEPRRMLQQLSGLTSQGAINEAARMVCLGVAELFAQPDLYTGIVGSTTESTIGEDRQEKLADYLKIITEKIQEGAEMFNDRNLWAIIDDVFIKNISPELAAELSPLSNGGQVAESEIAVVFERLNDLAVQFASAQHENREFALLVGLIADFTLRRLNYATGQLSSRPVREMQDTTVRDRLAEKLAVGLGKELLSFDSSGQAPLFLLLRRAEGSGQRFLGEIFKGYLHLKEDMFHAAFLENPLARELKYNLVRAYETLGACGAVLYPRHFASILKANFAGFQSAQATNALSILKYAVGQDTQLHEFVLLSAVGLFGHGSLQIRSSLESLLQDLAEPFCKFFGRYGGRPVQGCEIVYARRAELIDRVLLPLARNGQLSEQSKENLAPFLRATTEFAGVEALVNIPGVGLLVSEGALTELGAEKIKGFITATLTSLFSKFTLDDYEQIEEAVGRLARDLGGMLAAAGVPGIESGVKVASAQIAQRREVEALGLFCGAADAALRLHGKGQRVGSGSDQTLSLLVTNLIESCGLQVSQLRAPRSMERTTTGRQDFNPATDLDDLVAYANSQGSVQSSDYAALLKRDVTAHAVAALWGKVLRSLVSTGYFTPAQLLPHVTTLNSSHPELVTTTYFFSCFGATSGLNQATEEQRLARCIQGLASNSEGDNLLFHEDLVRIRTFLQTHVQQFPNVLVETGPVMRTLLGSCDNLLPSSASSAEKGSRVFARGSAAIFGVAAQIFPPLLKNEQTPVGLRVEVKRRIQLCVGQWLKDVASSVETSLPLTSKDIALLLDPVLDPTAQPAWVGKIGFLMACYVNRVLGAMRQNPGLYARQVEPLIPPLRRIQEFLQDHPVTLPTKSNGEVTQVDPSVTIQGALAAVAKWVDRTQQIHAPAGVVRVGGIPKIPFKYSPYGTVHIPLLTQRGNVVRGLLEENSGDDL